MQLVRRRWWFGVGRKIDQVFNQATDQITQTKLTASIAPTATRCHPRPYVALRRKKGSGTSKNMSRPPKRKKRATERTLTLYRWRRMADSLMFSLRARGGGQRGWGVVEG
jgi:hypothetical protein